jgi:DNA-binding NarL/FixJ family response regulator
VPTLPVPVLVPVQAAVPTRVVLVDDHEMLRAGVRDFVASFPGYTVVGEAASARQGLIVIEAQKPDLVLMDIALPGMDGIVATREVLRRVPTARVIILSGHAQIHDVVDAIDAGATAYVLKSDPPETLKDALDHSARGRRYLAPVLVTNFPSALKPSPRTGGVLEALSEREREIFRLAADCRTAVEIAHDLCIARKTVDVHLNRINRKLALRDRADLVRLAASIGLVHSIRPPSRLPPPVEGGGKRPAAHGAFSI